MLNIGNRKYRNLQEQVAYNTECIEKLDKYLDGITVEDKLVVINSDSGTFTDEELVILSGPLAFISNGDKVWIKVSETDSQFVYKAIDIEASEVGGAYFNIGGTKIVVDRESGAFNTSSDTIFTTYSKSQIDSIIANINDVKADKTEVALKANIAGQAFTGEISAPSIVEAMRGYSFTKAGDTSKIHYEYKYAGIVKNGNKLTYVVYVQLTALNDIGALSLSVALGQFTVPNSVGDKLFPSTQGSFTDVLATSAPTLQLASSNYAFKNATCVCRKFGNTVLAPYFYNRENIANGEIYNLRVEMTFLLSNNLAS